MNKYMKVDTMLVYGMIVLLGYIRSFTYTTIAVRITRALSFDPFS